MFLIKEAVQYLRWFLSSPLKKQCDWNMRKFKKTWEILLVVQVTGVQNQCVQEATTYHPVWLCTRQLMVLFSPRGGGWGGGGLTQQCGLPMWKAQGCSSENFNGINPDMAPVLFGFQKIPLKNGHNYIFIIISLGQPLKIPWHLKIIIWLFIQNALSETKIFDLRP